MKTQSNEALAIKIGDRYFCRFGNKDQALTAWHLAGAKMFMNKADAIPSLAKLAQKKKECEIIKVEVAVKARHKIEDIKLARELGVSVEDL